MGDCRGSKQNQGETTAGWRVRKEGRAGPALARLPLGQNQKDLTSFVIWNRGKKLGRQTLRCTLPAFRPPREGRVEHRRVVYSFHKCLNYRSFCYDISKT